MNDQLWLPIVFVGFLVLVGVASWVSSTQKPQSRTSPDSFPYEREPYLLSQAERYFFYALNKAAPRDLHIFPKVRLIDLVRVRPGTPNVLSYKNRILQKHVDFVLCSRDNFSPVLVVELDDSSHQSAKRQARDDVKDGILAAAGLPILRVRAKNTYDGRDLTQAVLSKLRTMGEVV